MAIPDNLKRVAGIMYRSDESPLDSLQKLAVIAFDAAGNPIGPGVAVDSDPGPEKVTNGACTTGAGWTLTAGWNAGGSTIDHNADGTTTLEQNVSAVANEVYRVTYTVGGWSVGTVTVGVGGATGTARGANGTYTEYLVASTTGNLIFTPTSTSRFTLDDISVKRVALAAADRVTMWAGDRLSAGVAQAGDAGLFLRSEDGTLLFLGDKLGPVVNDGLALGSATESFSDLFLASGGVINWNNGDVTVIHSSNALTFLGTATKMEGGSSACIRISDGNVATPGLNFINDLNTGIIRLAADVIGIVTGGVERLRINDSGTLLINATAAYAGEGELLEVNKSADDGGIALFCWSTTDAERALLEFHKSASATIGTKAMVADEEAAGGIIWKVADGAVNWSPIASIEGFVDTAPGAGDTGGRLVFYTTADGAASVTEAMRIDSAQRVLINGASSISGYPLSVAGDILLSGANPSTRSIAVGGADNGHILQLVPSSSLTHGQVAYLKLGGVNSGIGAGILGRYGSDSGTTGSLTINQILSGAVEVARLVSNNAGMSVGFQANAQALGIKTLTELTTINAAASTDTVIQIPANALVVGVSVRVTTVIPTAATFDVGVSGATTRYGTGISTTANTTNPGTNDSMRYYAAAVAITLTPNLSPADNTGRVRTTIHYIDITPPTS